MGDDEKASNLGSLVKGGLLVVGGLVVVGLVVQYAVPVIVGVGLCGGAYVFYRLKRKTRALPPRTKAPAALDASSELERLKERASSED